MELAVHTSSLLCLGSHVKSVTLLLCISTAASCSFNISHIQTVVAMFSLYDTRKAPSQLHESLPAAQERHVLVHKALKGTNDLRPKACKLWDT